MWSRTVGQVANLPETRLYRQVGNLPHAPPQQKLNRPACSGGGITRPPSATKAPSDGYWRANPNRPDLRGQKDKTTQIDAHVLRMNECAVKSPPKRYRQLLPLASHLHFQAHLNRPNRDPAAHRRWRTGSWSAHRAKGRAR